MVVQTEIFVVEWLVVEWG